MLSVKADDKGDKPKMTRGLPTFQSVLTWGLCVSCSNDMAADVIPGDEPHTPAITERVFHAAAKNPGHGVCLATA